MLRLGYVTDMSIRKRVTEPHLSYLQVRTLAKMGREICQLGRKSFETDIVKAEEGTFVVPIKVSRRCHSDEASSRRLVACTTESGVRNSDKNTPFTDMPLR